MTFHAAARTILAVCLMVVASATQAHLMVEQHGTLKFANGGAFLVLSIPVSAFSGIDDNDDGVLELEELNRHAAAIEDHIHENVQLLNNAGEPLPLQGLLLSLVAQEHTPGSPARQLIALGRYQVDDATTPFSLRIALRGKSAAEQRFEITTTRNDDVDEWLFTPDHAVHAVVTQK